MTTGGSSLRGVWRTVRSGLTSSLWPLPVLGIVLAIGLGIGMTALDGLLEQPGQDHPLTLAFGGGPSAARDLLAAIAGSLISVTGLTFSFTVVALQLSSSQHSPRLLQTFVTDRVVQGTLAQLVATFVYALTVLRTVRAEDSIAGVFVPRLSVTVGFALTVVSVIALVLFLGHLARSLRVETMLRDVHDEARTTFDRELTTGAEEVDAALPSTAPVCVSARTSGFVVDVDEARLVAAASDGDLVLRLVPRIGDSVVAGTPIAHVWTRRAGVPVDIPDLERLLRRTVSVAFERSPARDVAYSLRKVVDITVRALSPGSNDPTTAVHGLSHVSALLGDMLARPPRPLASRDADGVLRLVVPQWDLLTLFRLGLEEPLQFASGQPAVLRRMAAVLRELAWHTREGTTSEESALCGEVDRYLERLVGTAEDSTSVTAEEIDRWRRDVAEARSGRWPANR